MTIQTAPPAETFITIPEEDYVHELKQSLKILRAQERGYSSSIKNGTRASYKPAITLLQFNIRIAEGKAKIARAERNKEIYYRLGIEVQ